MRTIQKILAERIKFYRARKGWKQTDLADACGFSLGTIANVEIGKVWVSPESIREIASALGVSEGALFQDLDLNHDKSGDIPAEIRTALETMYRKRDHNQIAAVERVVWTFAETRERDAIEKLIKLRELAARKSDQRK